MPNESPIQLTITAIAAGGDGVGRHEGKAVFVPRTAPGDRVRVRVTESRPSLDRAEMVDILEPGPGRVQPPCRFWNRCGGCPLMHLDYPAQLEAKRQMVLDALQRIGRLEVGVLSITASPSTLHYRDRIQLHQDSGRVGYHAAGTNALVEITECLIARPEINQSLADRPALQGRIGESRRFELRLEQDKVQIHPLGRDNQPAFRQVNPEGNRLLVQAVVEAVGSGGPVLELFCGAGNFTLPLLQRGLKVSAVEGQASALANLRQAAEAAGVSPRLATYNTDLFNEVALARLAKDVAPNRWRSALLDPPRTGATKAVQWLARLAIPRVIYVSCDPATLARDLRRLAEYGYHLSHVQAFDLFPQTAHVETLAVMERP